MTEAAKIRRRRGDLGGFGILELMIAMALLVATMAAALPFVDQIMARFQMARDHYVAATICQERIERARAIPYSDLPLMADDGVSVDDFGNPGAPGGRFRRTTTVLTDNPSTGLTTMRVQTDICCCSRWGWRTVLHPIRSENRRCRFEGMHEKMSFLYTDLRGDQ